MGSYVRIDPIRPQFGGPLTFPTLTPLDDVAKSDALGENRVARLGDQEGTAGRNRVYVSGLTPVKRGRIIVAPVPRTKFIDVEEPIDFDDGVTVVKGLPSAEDEIEIRHRSAFGG